jgi:plastocyanin
MDTGREENEMFGIFRMGWAVALLGVVPLCAPELQGQEQVAMSSADEPRVFAVSMVDKSPTQFVFEPSVITVEPGDVVRFVQEGIQPHNVEFRDGPQGANMPGAPTMGPFLITAGATYDIVIGETVAEGEYDFVCTPHQALGMKGKIIVSSAARSGAR